MPDRLPPLPALQAFEAAARHENFAAAAQELNLSQSAVSHRVRSLEHHLGYPLFERLPRGLRLTESAKAYLPSVRRAFEDILSATSGVFGHGGKATLTIRAPVTYTALWLTPLVNDFVKEFPHMEIHLTSSIWVERLASGGTDVEIRLGRGHWPDFEAEFLFRDTLQPVCSPATADKLGVPVDPHALSHCSLVHVMGSEDHWAKFFAEHGIDRKRQRIDFSVDSSMTAAELAVTSDRVALLHQSFASVYVKSGRLVRATHEAVTPLEAMYLLIPTRSEQRNPDAILFEKWLRQRVGGE